MRLLAAACLCFGLAACEDPQPDVSAHTILNLIVQTQGDPDVMPETLGALYEQVTIQANGRTPTGRYIILKLGRDDMPELAQLRCDVHERALPGTTTDYAATLPALIADALVRPLADRQTRVTCRFNYFDRIERVTNFMTQAEMWALSNIGPWEDDLVAQTLPAKTAYQSDPHMVLSLISGATGAVYSGSLVFLMDF